jgi:Zn-dependent protease
MPTRSQGSIHLFRVAGIDVYLHWWWFIVALYEIQGRSHYTSIVWKIAEYLSLFLIVLLHEFGHALACRSVGGTANKILLWPLGGVAYVDPPQRPGATLWSLFAGPLVNIVLAPILAAAYFYVRSHHWAVDLPNQYFFLRNLFGIDIGLLVFNMLPIYPLDGGQIFRSLLWFVMGRARSLMVATIFSFIGIAGLLVLAFFTRSIWSAVMAVYLLLSCWGGLQHARALLKIAKLPRRLGFTCPSCHSAPPLGAYWRCKQCNQMFDTFDAQAVCPHCSATYAKTMCLDCGSSYSQQEWASGRAGAAPVILSGTVVPQPPPTQ